MTDFATIAGTDERRSADRSLTDRWYIEATRKDAHTVEAVDLIASHNKHRKTIDVHLRRIAVSAGVETFAVGSLLSERRATSMIVHRAPCSRYSATKLHVAMRVGRDRLDKLAYAEDLKVAELFRDEPHY